MNTAYDADPNVAVENVSVNENKAQKLIRDGRLIIIKEGKEYDMMGNFIKQ